MSRVIRDRIGFLQHSVICFKNSRHIANQSVASIFPYFNLQFYISFTANLLWYIFTCTFVLEGHCYIFGFGLQLYIEKRLNVVLVLIEARLKVHFRPRLIWRLQNYVKGLFAFPAIPLVLRCDLVTYRAGFGNEVFQMSSKTLFSAMSNLAKRFIWETIFQRVRGSLNLS